MDTLEQTVQNPAYILALVIDVRECAFVFRKCVTLSMDAEKEKQVYLYLNSKVRYDMAFPCNFDFNIKGNISLCYSTNNQYSLHIWFQNTIIICIIIDSYHGSITVTFIIF